MTFLILLTSVLLLQNVNSIIHTTNYLKSVSLNKSTYLIQFWINLNSLWINRIGLSLHPNSTFSSPFLLLLVAVNLPLNICLVSEKLEFFLAIWVTVYPWCWHQNSVFHISNPNLFPWLFPNACICFKSPFAIITRRNIQERFCPSSCFIC